MIALAIALLVTAPNPASLNAPRNAYATCLKQFETKSIEAKMSKATYETAIKDACPAESQALINALVAYDVAMGSKRSNAEANAKLDVADYWAESIERVDYQAPH